MTHQSPGRGRRGTIVSFTESRACSAGDRVVASGVCALCDVPGQREALPSRRGTASLPGRAIRRARAGGSPDVTGGSDVAFTRVGWPAGQGRSKVGRSLEDAIRFDADRLEGIALGGQVLASVETRA